MTQPIDRVLDKLNYVGARTNGKYKCHCPAHDDQTESLSVSVGKGDKVLLHCHAGCDTDKVLAALGLTWPDLSPNGSVPSSNGTSKPTIVATYDYTDEQGGLLYQAVRYQPKNFRQRQPDGKGGWIWSVTKPPVRKVLYRLPELVAADPAEWVYLVEGEKDADNVAGLGLVATTNVGGAKKWAREYIPPLSRRKVCILPDNDQAGQDHAKKVAGELQGNAAEVVILNLPGLGGKEDVSDWIARGGTAGELQQLTAQAAAATPTWTPVATSTSADCLRELARLGYSFRWNELDDTVEVNGKPIDKGIAAQIRTQMRDLGFKGKEAIEDAYTMAAYQNRYHPVRDYLNGLTWDGQDHFGELCQYFKDKHDPIVYHNAAGDIIGSASVFRVWLWRWMLGAVHKTLGSKDRSRVQNPLLGLDGAQDIGKSHFTGWLCSSLPGLYLESPIHPDNKEHDRYQSTKFIWEVAELGATTRKADREALKGFITRDEVTFRVPWNPHPVKKPTLANYIGTINNEAGFLTDPTGNRRFLVCTLESIDWRYEKAINVDQVWAQVVAAYHAGESWQLTPDEKRVRDALNRGYEQEDPYEGMVLKYFEVDPSREDWFIHTADIISHLRAMGAKDGDKAMSMAVGTTMRRLKLTKAQKTVNGQRGWGYHGIKIK